MAKGLFGEEQIIGILKEQAGQPVAAICRRHGIGGAALAEEHREIEKLPAEAMPDVATLRAALGQASDARCTQNGCDPGDRGERLLAASRLRVARTRPNRRGPGQAADDRLGR